jgi:hypothetical protein
MRQSELALWFQTHRSELAHYCRMRRSELAPWFQTHRSELAHYCRMRRFELVPWFQTHQALEEVRIFPQFFAVQA